MKKYLGLLLISLATVLYSCKKEYITQEITNIEDGTKILSGINDPSLTTGKIGGFYINTASKTLFGPKTESSWGPGVSLNGVNGIDGKNGENGTNGTNGINGNTILNGKGVPNASLGKEGDFYLDTENLLFYGAKTTTGWGTPFSLKQTTTSNGIRVLLKENAKIHEEFTGFSLKEDQYSIRLNVGDISKYLNDGSVFVQSRINEGGWTDDDNRIEKNTDNFEIYFQVNLEEGYKYVNNTIIIPVNIGMYSNKSLTQQEISNVLTEAKNWINTLNVQIKVTLIPADKVEKISKVL